MINQIRVLQETMNKFEVQMVAAKQMLVDFKAKQANELKEFTEAHKLMLKDVMDEKKKYQVAIDTLIKLLPVGTIVEPYVAPIVEEVVETSIYPIDDMFASQYIPTDI